MNYQEIIKFHGHECPGLAMGYRMARAAMDELNAMRSEDEEIVAIVENDSCGVDALQCVSGCTFGKGNLLLYDYGKHVYTLYSRTTRVGVRVVYHGKGVPDDIRDDRQALANWILNAPLGSIISVVPTTVPNPEHAKIRDSITCAHCGELVMESRLREIDGQRVCIPCAEKEIAR